jgi:fructose-1-phosphate kinase PfkB-like protein
LNLISFSYYALKTWFTEKDLESKKRSTSPTVNGGGGGGAFNSPSTQSILNDAELRQNFIKKQQQLRKNTRILDDLQTGLSDIKPKPIRILNSVSI